MLVVGLGMIGGSFAKALKSRGLAYVYGADRRTDELSLGISHEVIDASIDLTKDMIQKMDVILLATPVRAMESIFEQLKPMLSSHTIVTDVGSTKVSVIAAAKSVFGYLPPNFILGHPIAGAEKSGVLAANENLFANNKVVLTPQSNCDPLMLDTLHSIWSSVGAEVISMDAKNHDYVLANSSHLPHLLAYTLVDALANDEQGADIFRFAAGGFSDFTRIASSDPTMWRDVFLANKDATLKSLDNFEVHLKQMRAFIEHADGAAMFGVFARSKSARDHFLRLQKEKNSIIEPIRSVSITVLSALLIKGSPTIVGDKKLSHLAVVLAALEKRVTRIENIDTGGDINITLQALQDMGVLIERFNKNSIRIHGVGLRGLKAPIAPINVGQSVISMYVLLPLLAVQDFVSTLTSTGELLDQPFPELVSLVRSMGRNIQAKEMSMLPITLAKESVKASREEEILLNHSYSQEMACAVLMKAILLQGSVHSFNTLSKLLADSQYIFEHFGYSVDGDEKTISLSKLDHYQVKADIELCADKMKTSWLILLSCLSPGASLRLDNLYMNKRYVSYLGTLISMGAKIKSTQHEQNTNIASKLHVGFAPLKSFSISKDEVREYSGNLLFLCVAAVCAAGRSTVEGVDLLPPDQQDRIEIFIDALKILKVPCTFKHGVLEIEGQTSIVGGVLDCAGDYDLALAMLALGLRSRNPIKVDGCERLLNEFEEFEAITSQVGFVCETTLQ